MLSMPNTSARQGSTPARPGTRKVVTIAAIVLAATSLAASGSACSSSTSSGSITTSTTSPEDRISSDAEVATGLAAIQTLTPQAVQQLTSDQAAAKKTVEQAYDAWYEIEGA